MIFKNLIVDFTALAKFHAKVLNQKPMEKKVNSFITNNGDHE